MVDSARLPIPPRSKPEMNAVGYLMATVLLLVMLPLLPILLVLWVFGALTQGGGEEAETEPSFEYEEG